MLGSDSRIVIVRNHILGPPRQGRDYATIEPVYVIAVLHFAIVINDDCEVGDMNWYRVRERNLVGATMIY